MVYIAYTPFVLPHKKCAGCIPIKIRPMAWFSPGSLSSISFAEFQRPADTRTGKNPAEDPKRLKIQEDPQ
jgi:hypothetical protein